MVENTQKVLGNKTPDKFSHSLRRAFTEYDIITLVSAESTKGVLNAAGSVQGSEWAALQH